MSEQAELEALRRRVAELETLAAERDQMLEALHESETRLERALSGANLGLWDWDIQTGTLTFDDRWVEMLGYRCGDMEPHRDTWVNLIHPDDMPHVREVLDAHLEGRTPYYETEHRLKARSGDWLWVLDRGAVSERAEDGTPLHMAGTHLNITDRKRTEEAQREAHVQLDATLNALPDLLFELDRGGRIFYFHSSRSEQLYVPPQNFIGQTVEDTLPADAARVIMEALQEAEAQGRHTGATYALPMSGDIRWFELSIALKESPCAPDCRFIALVRDITDRKHTEEDLKYHIAFEDLVTTLSTRFINLPTEEIDTGIAHALETIGTFAGVDRSYVFLFSEGSTLMSNTHEWCAEGISPEIDNLQGIPSDILPWWMDTINRREPVHIPRVADLPPEASAERDILEPQGIQSLVAVPITSRGEVQGFIGFDSVRAEKEWTKDSIALLQIVGDMLANTLERKRAEEARAQLIEELDAFAHTVAHDLKNPLSIVLGLAEILESDEALPDVEREEFVRGIVQNSHKMTNIINALLLLARVRRVDEVPVEALHMEHVVAEALKRLALLVADHRPQITIPDTWPAARGYAPWVEEVWANYLSNAIKYGASGAEPFRIELGAEPHPGDKVRFWVRDHGPGMTPEEQISLFTPFTRLGQANVEGHGLGLSIVQRIVARLGGEVSVESAPGEGSTFSFTLPAGSGGISCQQTS